MVADFFQGEEPRGGIWHCVGRVNAVVCLPRWRPRPARRPPQSCAEWPDPAPETAARRKAVGRDRYERDLALLDRVRKSYLEQLQETWVRVDGEQSKEDVAEEVFSSVALRLASLLSTGNSEVHAEDS